MESSYLTLEENPEYTNYAIRNIHTVMLSQHKTITLFKVKEVLFKIM